jgi:hypothetical protein
VAARWHWIAPWTVYYQFIYLGSAGDVTARVVVMLAPRQIHPQPWCWDGACAASQIIPKREGENILPPRPEKVRRSR